MSTTLLSPQMTVARFPRMRPDLVIAPQGKPGARVWVVKDPVSLQYFHLAEEEYAILRMLDGHTDPAEVIRRFERQFAPQQISSAGFHTFLAQLHAQGLMLTDSPGQGEELLQRYGRRRNWERATAGLQWFAIRFRGWDPTTLLTKLAPLGNVLFSRTMGILVAMLCLISTTLVATQFEIARQQMPTVAAFFSGQNAWLLIAAIMLLKLLHELGHALACRRFGGECHEIGVMLLAGIPCLYCNVTSAWMLPDRRQRIIISAAGMYIELLVASVATLLWWYSEPGLLHAFCWNLVVAASVGTLLVNGNPLLRYDGYYILSDLTGVPNLWRQSQELLRGWLARVCLGVELYADRWLPQQQQRGWLVWYAMAAWVYRWLVLASIYWLVYQVLAERRLQAVAHVFLALSIAGLMMGPLLAGMRLLKDPVRRQQLVSWRPFVCLSLIAVGLSAVLFVPLPYRVPAVAMIEPVDAARVYVTVPGSLQTALPTGKRVQQGEVLATLANPELELEVAQLRSEVAQQKILIDGMQTRRMTDQLPAAQAALADLEQQLTNRENDLSKLELIAPVAGVILPPPAIPSSSNKTGQLNDWAGTPLEQRNRSAFLSTGTLLCLVGEPERIEAVLTVSQDDVELVAPGQAVRLLLDEAPGILLTGEVTKLARIDVQILTREHVASQRIPTQTNERGVARPVETLYQAKVKLDDTDRPLLLRSGGNAKITVASHSLAWRGWRFLQRTFRFSTLSEP